MKNIQIFHKLDYTLPTPSSEEPIIYIGVFPFINVTNDSKNDWISISIQNSIESNIVSLPGIKIIERTQIEKILSEQEFQLSGITDTTTLIKYGNIANIQYIISGSYIIINNDIKIEIKITEIETAMIIKTLSIQGTITNYFLCDEILKKTVHDGLNTIFSKKIQTKKGVPIFQNGNFEKPLSNTYFCKFDDIDPIESVGAKSTWKIENKELVIKIIKNGPGQHFIHGGFVLTTPLEYGETYRVSFKVKSDTNNLAFDIIIIENYMWKQFNENKLKDIDGDGNECTNIYAESFYTLTTFQNFNFEFIMNLPTHRPLFEIFVGENPNGSYFTIDDIQIEKVN